MESRIAAALFAALCHPDRLAILRLLMRFAPRAQRPTEIAQMLGLKKNTLSHHLGELTSTGLLEVTRQGRSLFYSVNQDRTHALIGYLAFDVGRARADLLAPLVPRRHPCGGDMTLGVLFLCSGNSARSIMAEALLRDLGKGRFRAYSAGIQPAQTPHPEALQTLRDHGHDVSVLRSKHLSEFQRADAPALDIVITVCDRAAAQDCPPWAGYPVMGHWGLPDPAASQAFAQTYHALRQRLAELVALPQTSVDRTALQTRIDTIDTNALTQERA